MHRKCVLKPNDKEMNFSFKIVRNRIENVCGNYLYLA